MLEKNLFILNTTLQKVMLDKSIISQSIRNCASLKSLMLKFHFK